jgi:hypothetical protein
MDQPVTTVLKESAHDARELLRLELELAGNELRQEVRSLARVAVAFGVAAIALAVTFSVLALALVRVLGGTLVAILGLAGGALVVTVVAAGIGNATMPRTFLRQTLARLRADVAQISEGLR